MALTELGFQGSTEDPCCYYKYSEGRLVFCLLWVDDCMFLGNESDVVEEKDKMMRFFECEDLGFVTQYDGYKIKINSNRSIKFTQPILIKSFVDEFGAGGKNVRTPATAGQTLQAGEVANELDICMKKK